MASEDFFPDDEDLIVMEDDDEFGDVPSDPEYEDGDSGEDDDDEEEEESGYEDESLEDDATPGIEGPTAEMEIEGDFDRLVENIRGSDGTYSGSGMLGKVWDFNIEERDAEFRDDLRAASGVGRRRGGKRGRRPGPALSPQVRSLIGDGNQAYVDADIPKAMQIMQEVIRLEPRASSAWSVLAQCYEDMNEGKKALQLRIMAAHLRHDSEEWERLAVQSRALGYYQQALYCYGKIYSLDPSNVDALWDRATVAKETGDLRTARNALLSILKRFPHDLTVLSELRPILIDLSDLSLCASLFQNALEHYQAIYLPGPNPASPEPTFGLIDLLVLSDLYNSLGEYEKAVHSIRKGWRWLQGRGEQKWWDVVEDDREFDIAGGVVREGELGSGGYELDVNARQRLAVARIKMGEVEEGKMHANIVLSHDVLDYAPLFAEIAEAYFEQDMFADARPIYELLGTDAGTSSLYILMQTAACYRMLGDMKEAAEVYEHVKSADPTNNDAKMKLAEIYEILNEPRKALELVYEVIDSRKKRPPTASTPTSQPQGSLFEETRSRGTGKSSNAASVRAQNRLSHVQLRELEAQKEAEVLKGWKRVKELWPRLLGGGDRQEEVEMEWMLEAEKLVETFRETRNLFLTTRHNPFRGMFPRARKHQKEGDEDEEADEERMVSRLHLDLEHDSNARKSRTADAKAPKVIIFRGVLFDDWLRMFMQFAFLLTQRNQFDVADEVLRHILQSNAYQARELQNTIRLAIITCAIVAKRHSIVVEQSRKLIGTHQFNNEPQRILLASLASGLHPTDSFITSTLQKHIFREIKIGDMAVHNKEGLKWNPLSKRYVPVQGVITKAMVGEDGGEDDGEGDDEVPDDVGSTNGKEKERTISAVPDTPKKDNPFTVAVYGQICNAAKSYQSAIFYLLHAYDYCPDDPVICLSLAIASIGRAMQRQSDNRHHLIAQAMAFLSRYRLIRGTTPEGMNEVEFNFGRAFHQLGLYSLAVRHYERALELVANRSLDDCGLAKETAYNLSLIYVMTGATPLAEALYRRWLSF